MVSPRISVFDAAAIVCPLEQQDGDIAPADAPGEIENMGRYLRRGATDPKVLSAITIARARQCMFVPGYINGVQPSPVQL